MPTIEEQVAALATSVQSLAAQSQAQENPYLAASASFNYITAPNQYGFAQNEMGWWQSEEGVIIDPTQGEAGVLFPTRDTGIDPANVPGSAQWMAKIQDEWSDEKADKWRKMLWDQGYSAAGLQSDKGGMGHDLVGALRTYHLNRYLSGGKVTPLMPTAATGNAAAVRETIDKVALMEMVKPWGEVAFGEELSEDEAAYFANKNADLQIELARKHPEWSLAQVQESAEIRTQKEFMETPGVKGAMRDAEEDEMDDSLRESIVSIAQLSGI